MGGAGYAKSLAIDEIGTAGYSLREF